jgi:hypothetical protein
MFLPFVALKESLTVFQKSLIKNPVYGNTGFFLVQQSGHYIE